MNDLYEELFYALRADTSPALEYTVDQWDYVLGYSDGSRNRELQHKIVCGNSVEYQKGVTDGKGDRERAK